jgi:protein-S-isoprenylcysteine O-methyltransferase Ste14
LLRDEITVQHDDGDMREKYKIWFRLRGILVTPVYIIAIFCTYRETETLEVKVLGLMIFLVGLFMRVWSQMHLHYRLKAPRKLTITGPYVYVRNPIYIGNTMILAGTTLISELVWLTPIMIIVCIVTYSLVIRYEENHLTNKYGQPYIDYLKNVPRWLPTSLWISTYHEHNQWNYFLPSIRAEVYIFWLLIMPIIKELYY